MKTYPEDIETGNLTSILGGLSLRIVEVSRNSDDSILGRSAQVTLGSLFHLCQGKSSHLGKE